MKWKTACCRPRASEQSGGGEDKFRYHTESFRTLVLPANYSWLQQGVCVCRDVCVGLCNSVSVCSSFCMCVLVCTCVWRLLLSECSFMFFHCLHAGWRHLAYTFQLEKVQVCMCPSISSNTFPRFSVRTYVCSPETKDLFYFILCYFSGVDGWQTTSETSSSKTFLQVCYLQLLRPCVKWSPSQLYHILGHGNISILYQYLDL